MYSEARTCPGFVGVRDWDQGIWFDGILSSPLGRLLVRPEHLSVPACTSPRLSCSHQGWLEGESGLSVLFSMLNLQQVAL